MSPHPLLPNFSHFFQRWHRSVPPRSRTPRNEIPGWQSQEGLGLVCVCRDQPLFGKACLVTASEALSDATTESAGDNADKSGRAGCTAGCPPGARRARPEGSPSARKTLSPRQDPAGCRPRMTRGRRQDTHEDPSSWHRWLGVFSLHTSFSRGTGKVLNRTTCEHWLVAGCWFATLPRHTVNPCNPI